MSDFECFLITIFCENSLLRVGLKIRKDSVPPDLLEFPMEPENRLTLHDLLPLHVRTCGPIVAVESIFEITDKS